MNEHLWGNQKVIKGVFSGDGGGGDMGDNNYVTHKELELTKEAIENKITSTENSIAGKLDVIETKLDNQEEKLKEVDKKINWLIALAILSIGVPVFLKLFFP